jgi:Tfp pilus assembly pilus retraction ATPase PilT
LETLERNILTGGDEEMRTLDESIRRLFKAGLISRETAEQYVSDSQYLLR